MKVMMKETLRIFIWMTILTGGIYPLLITGFAQLSMKRQADGDFVIHKDKIIGAFLIGQKFEDPKYFWGRPSSIDYNPLPSGGSNLGPISIALKKAIDARKEKILQSKIPSKNIPSELLFASGSGLDPHISLNTAYFQIDRIAQFRNMDNKKIKTLIDELAVMPSLGFLGNPYVNVLTLNQALDERYSNEKSAYE